MAVRALSRYVRRYTTLSSAFQTLRQQKLVLLSPSSWDDSNDTFFMDLYRSRLPERTLRALCFTMATETYHHWKVFADGIDGICIEFERQSLELAIDGRADFRSGPVEYLQVQQLQSLGPQAIGRMPFIKRDGYSDEREWRVIVECDEEKEFVDLPIQIDWINAITFNPWMPPSLADNLRDVIRSIAPELSASLRASSLTNSRKWKAAGKDVFQKMPSASS